MSFRELQGTKSGGGGHASKQQPNQRPQDSSHERSIKANIQEMQENIRMAAEQLDRARTNVLSRRTGESLDKFLERSRILTEETEQLFRDWTVQLAGEPAERHRKRFSFEKLKKAFESEMAHLKDVVRRRAVSVKQQAADPKRDKFTPASERIGAENDEENGLLNDSDHQDYHMSQMHEDVTMQSRVAQEREEGIRRIQNQVADVNQIFRDLASIVNEQGQQFETIENQTEASATNTKHAVRDLKKAVDNQRPQQGRVFCALFAAILFVCYLLMPEARNTPTQEISAPRRVLGIQRLPAQTRSST
eukprot:TRINITY_DN7626_c0_g1_i4.p1 TRINITY_DN7626_c0_g1~~TRINITY_DN7626_c0_g1_i4.p1  ORF type:complete len:305 (-),score=52.56 TRINITY_DN7626_c0_g1_i4:140-1054(-)